MVDFCTSSPITTAGTIFFRVLVHYGARILPWDVRELTKVFNLLFETLDSLIFIHNDFYISKEKPRLHDEPLKNLLNNHMNASSFYNPLVIVTHFILDCDSTDAGPRAELKSAQKIPSGMHKLNVDAFFPVTSGALHGDLFVFLRNEVRAFLTAYVGTLKSILVTRKSLPRSLTAYYFRHEDQLLRILYPPACKNEAKLREEIHELLNLPRIPIVRRGLAIFPTRSFRRLLGPNKENLVSPHLLLPASDAGNESDTCLEIVRGRYTYKHYLQDGVDDKNWGCAYRSLQTLASWLLWQGTVTPLQPLPSHRDIQEALVRVGDKTAQFVGSRQWIGSLEVSFCLQELYNVQCRLLPVARGRDFAATAAGILAEHFASGGGPVMVGGGQLAHTIIGIQMPNGVLSGTNQTRFLVLDPHYTGTPARVETILGRGWVGWKEESFWRSDVPYNLCFLPPPLDAAPV